MLLQSIIWRGVVLAALLLIGTGCQPDNPASDDGNATQAAVDEPVDPGDANIVRARHTSPRKAVSEFLHALKTGDETRATSLLTAKAQQEMVRTEAVIRPPGSPTAEFEVTEVKYLGEQKSGAHVLSTWIDTNELGKLQTYEIVWILRHETEGWAIAGMATRVFANEDLLILNFEDPLEAQQKRNAVDREIARRGNGSLQ